MTNNHSFPLCRLPSLACNCIVKQLGLREKYILTTLSKRAKQAVKLAIYMEKYTFHFEINCAYSIIRLGKNGESWNNVKMLRARTDHVKNSTAHLESIHEIFKCSKISLRISGYLGVFYHLVPHLVSMFRKLKLKFHKIETPGYGNKLFEYVMERFREADTLINCVYTSQNYEWKETVPFNFRRCTLRTHGGFSMDHITRLFTNCRFFEVYNNDHRLTPESLNRFLRSWIEGSKLEYLKIKFLYRISLPLILDGIEREPVQEAYIEKWLVAFGQQQAYRIRQNNGVEAVVCALYGREFVLTTNFGSPRCDLWDDDDDVNSEEDD